MDISRRGMFGFLPGIGAAVLAASKGAMAAAAPVAVDAPTAVAATTFNWAKMELFKRGVIGQVGADVFDSWFASMEMERLENGRLTVSVPAMFVKKWVDGYYSMALLRGAQRMDATVEEVRIVVREPRPGRLEAKSALV